MFNSLPSKWKQVLRTNFIDISKLADFLELNAEQRKCLLTRPRFVLNLPLRLAEKIQKGTLDDPILRQFVPLEEEEVLTNGFQMDPVGDVLSCRSPKLLKKYHGRILLLTTGACAMHCRFCFRQNYSYEINDKLFEDELAIIAGDTSIHEVILSGGDPLSLDDSVLDRLLQKLSAISHVTKIRFHTRFPVGIPERIDSAFLDMLSKVSSQIWFVLHSNHPKELDNDVLAALKNVQKLGISVVNQSVLLKDVNDNLEVMSALCQKLIDNGIMPYYLHQLDRVQGAAHFEVDEKHGLDLIAALQKRLPGYGVPKYVKETAGKASKTSL